MRGYGLASLTRESDGGGAPSLPSERGAVGDAGARELAGRMARKHFVIIGRDAAPPVSDILRRDSAASGMRGAFGAGVGRRRRAIPTLGTKGVW